MRLCVECLECVIKCLTFSDYNFQFHDSKTLCRKSRDSFCDEDDYCSGDSAEVNRHESDAAFIFN